MFRAELGDEWEPALARMNEAPTVTHRADGYTQDESSQWVAASVEAGAGERIFDMCAAPGGKATAIAGTTDGARVVSPVITEPVGPRLVAENAATLGLPIPVVVADGTAPPFPAGRFDAVLLDAPCSGLGALRRRADARWRITADDVDRTGGAAAASAVVGGRAGAARRTADLQRLHHHRRRVDRPPDPRRLRDRRPPADRRHLAAVRSRVAGAAPGRRHRRHGARSVPSIDMSHDHGTGAPQQAKVLTVSDGVAHGVRDDASGRALVEQLTGAGFDVVDHRVTADGADLVAGVLAEMADGFAGLIVSTGGTGFAPRDQTPEGTRAVIEREAPGLAEAMRLCSPLGRLSRGVVGHPRAWRSSPTRPGSTKGCVEQLDAVLDVIPHALRLLHDADTSH